MAHLKSFKYLESGESDRNEDQSLAMHSMSAPGVQADESKSEKESSSSVESGSSSRSSETARIEKGSTVVGGNLTSDGASSSSGLSLKSEAEGAKKASVEESQSARVDLGEEGEEESEKGHQTGSESGQTEGSADGNVTKIEIDHAHRETRMQSRPNTTVARTKQDMLANQQPPNTPRTPRLKLYMPRSQTSPSHLNQLAKSSMLSRGLGSVTPSGLLASPLMGARRPQSPGDNTSQYSYAMQQRNTQFEIRWHNVRLYARPKSRLPRLLTDSLPYKALFGSAKAEDAWHEKTCYSPPVQHKIPPTIDERFEMKTQESSELKCVDLGGAKHEQQPPMSAIYHSSSLGNIRLEPNESAPPKARCILNNVSGQVFSGQMSAILGPSGVGKTTLLNSLTGRNTLDGTGRVSLIGANDSKRMSVVTVPQNDVLPGKLTTLEDLQFTSRLKNPQARFEHRHNIERIVKCLHMEKFLHTRIERLSGGEARRLSIARELLNSPDILILDEPTSGLDANTCKKIITALRDIVEHSDNILDKPMSIIITIHQPQQEVYNLFHRIYVMAIGGRVIYEGLPQMLMPTFFEQSSLSRVTPIEQLNENPAIVAIEVASGEFGAQIIDELAIYHENQVYEEFVLYNNGMGSLAGGGIGITDSPINTPRSVRQPHKSPLSVSRFDMSLHRKRLNSIDSSTGRPTPNIARRQPATGLGQFDRMSSFTSLSYASTYDADLPEPTSKLKVDKRLRRSVVMKSNFMSHTRTLINRCWLLTKRDMFLMAIRIIGFLGVAGGTVQIFSNALDPQEHQCPKFESQVEDMYAYIGEVRDRLHGLRHALQQANSTHLFFFHMLLCITMVTSALAGLVFPLQMRMFMREYKNGWYSPASFIMSQTIAELPADIIGPLLTLIITYPLCHQPDSLYHWRFLGYGIVMVLCAIICKSQAQIAGAFLMDSVENSVFISCVLVTGPALLSGIAVRISQMSLPMQWLSYGSFLRYGFESMLALRYGYDMCPCDPEVVDGYPITASAQAIPPHLENLANGFLAVSLPASNNNTSLNDETDPMSSTAVANLIDERENLFLRFIRLVTDAGNMFQNGEQLGNCGSYRSLYLISMEIPNNVLTNWIPVMLLMFLISRILTYFAVKTVIKLRRN